MRAFGKNEKQVKQVTFYQAVGCEQCHSSGYLGRIAIYELLILDEEIRTLISERPVGAEIARMARQKGMRNLKEDGWLKAVSGLTTLSEIIRVTQ